VGSAAVTFSPHFDHFLLVTTYACKYVCNDELPILSRIGFLSLGSGKTETVCFRVARRYFQTKNPNLGNFAMKDVGIFYVHLVYFTAIWYTYLMDIWYTLRAYGILYEHLL
jgi:hypothetical protein